MKNKTHSKDNKPPSVDVIKMPSHDGHIDFKEPEDYLAEHPQMIINDCKYELFKGGILSFATPKLLAESIHRLRAQKTHSSA